MWLMHGIMVSVFRLSLDSIRVDVRNLREKTNKISNQVTNSESQEIRDQMDTYLQVRGAQIRDRVQITLSQQNSIFVRFLEEFFL